MTWVYFRTPKGEGISRHVVWEWPGAEAELGISRKEESPVLRSSAGSSVLGQVVAKAFDKGLKTRKFVLCETRDPKGSVGGTG